MTITLGDVTFDTAYTTVSEKLKEVGGRDGREITLAGVIPSEHTVAAIEGRLDAILAAVPEDACTGELRLRPGRLLLVRRTAFKRTIAHGKLVGSFELTLEADDALEASASLNTRVWSVTASGDDIALTPSGTAPAEAVVTLVASGALVQPGVSDGQRAVTYDGTIGDGATLVFDGCNGMATLDGDDVTPYVSGVFPRLAPDGTTLTYTDAASSSHTAAGTVAWRDRWY
ncbi:MAG TPA: hypothetical protein ENN80_05175 [Candidatus Hydrogenedentes bacterium]|nr:hypothetical protein [Candidatus Hydrogenedentota bacterium]